MEVGGSADVEENALTTSMCDLLGKIWSHGLITPHSKSAHTKNHYHNNNQIKSPLVASVALLRENGEDECNGERRECEKQREIGLGCAAVKYTR